VRPPPRSTGFSISPRLRLSSGLAQLRSSFAKSRLRRVFRAKFALLAASPTPRVINRATYPEAIESIAAWLSHAKEVYGVDVSYVSFNAASLGIDVLLSPDDYVQMIRLGGRRFGELGLNTKWLLGDCPMIGGCIDYVRPIWQTEDIRPYLGPLAFHTYDADTSSDDRLTELGDWAAQQGLEMMGSDNPLNDGNQPFMAMRMLRQLNEAFPPGSQVVATSPNHNSITLFAARAADGKFGVHLVNESLTKDAARLPKLHQMPHGHRAEFSGLCVSDKLWQLADYRLAR
jgi:hypothetical protein